MAYEEIIQKLKSASDAAKTAMQATSSAAESSENAELADILTQAGYAFLKSAALFLEDREEKALETMDQGLDLADMAVELVEGEEEGAE